MGCPNVLDSEVPLENNISHQLYKKGLKFWSDIFCTAKFSRLQCKAYVSYVSKNGHFIRNV